MSLIIKIVGILLLTILAIAQSVAGMRHDTTHKNIFRKITPWGKICMVLAVLAAAISIFQVIQDEREKIDAKNEAVLQHSMDSVQRLREIDKLNLKLEEQGTNLGDLNSKLDEKENLNQELLGQNTLLLTTNKKIQTDQSWLYANNKELLQSVEEYRMQIETRDKNIEHLHQTIQANKRGIFKAIKFSGSYAQQNGASLAIIAGTKEEAFFSKLELAAKSQNAQTLLDTSNIGIKLFPDWMTPYYFKTIALLSQGKTLEALSLLSFVEENTYGDETYTKNIAALYKMLGMTDKADVLLKGLERFH